MAVKP